jgi:uncharacterized protein
MVLSQHVLNEIVTRVCSVSTPDRILLFGSAATGQMNSDSDVDVLLLTSEPRPLRQILASVRMALYGLELPIDLVVMRPEQFELSKDVIGGIAYPAAQTGKVVYEVA